MTFIVDNNYIQSFKVNKKLYGGSNAKDVKKLEKIANLVEEKEEQYANLSNDELTAQTQVLKQRLENGETLDDILPDAYAVCREASKRVLHQRHYYVQILGGVALHQGRICQMATGEGKTLTETLPAYLNALSGKGVHIVTVNEYLATRDMEWMGKVYNFLGLTVGVTLANMTAYEKQKAYACDITYGTNNEFGFDYLRDNMAKTRDECVQRKLNFAIIDEVDSILIDEARTPLIISGKSDKSSEMYEKANRLVYTMQKSSNVDDEGKPLNNDEEPNGHYVVDRKEDTVRLTDRGIAKAEKFFSLQNLSDPENIEINHYINNALRAHALMRRDKDYIIDKGRIVIVDAFTGRKMEGRRFSDGLHQAIEAKERVTIKEEQKTNATITFQNYFRLYSKMSGMTGTAKTEEKEFNTIYNIDVVAIPTHMPVIREDKNDLIYTTRAGKLRAIVAEIKRRHETGQPVLIGTVTVEKSEELAALLKEEGLRFEVLNAKFHKREATIIAQAGRLGAVTIATNMAGRGTDILLGGNPEFLAKKEMKRNGRDDIQIALATGFAPCDAETQKLRDEYAQLVEKYEAVTKVEREKVLQVGGLCVIGTERHDARRIDDQLRGRSGRQGDPGTSIFFVSAEDDMIRIFAGEKLKQLLQVLKFAEDEPIQHKLISRLIESAQKRIEGIHFSSRKSVLQYDDVNNQQRKVIYKERNRVLDGESVHEEILAMADEYARHALEESCEANENIHEWDLDKVNTKLKKFFPVEGSIVTEDDLTSARDVCNKLAELCRNILEAKSKEPNEDFTFDEIERYALLHNTDTLWMEHIDALSELRQGVGLQSIGQHDPLMVYKKEAFDMFERLNEEIQVRTIRLLFFGKIVRVLPKVRPKANVNPEKNLNGECPCGSGKKYKNCCYAKDIANQQHQDENRPLTKQDEYALKRKQRKEEKNKK